jgi:DNA polymerase-3 subunit alpha
MNGEKILADSIHFPEELERESVSGLHVLLGEPIDEDKLIRLRDLCIRNRGRCNVFLHTNSLNENSRAVKASDFLLVEPDAGLLQQLKEEKLVEKAWVR